MYEQFGVTLVIVSDSSFEEEADSTLLHEGRGEKGPFPPMMVFERTASWCRLEGLVNRTSRA